MLDIDEFLYVKNDFCVDGLLYRLVDFDSVLVNFRIFGDSGLQYSNDNRSVLRFVKSDSKLNKHGKPIINLKKTGNRMKFINSNFIIDTETGKPSPGVDPNKKKMIFSSQENDDDELAEIFCFKAKTLGEFLIRNNLPPDTSPE